MNAVLEIVSGSWLAMGFVKSLMFAAAGTAFIGCIRQRDLAASLWAMLLLLLPVAFFSGLLPVSLKALPKPVPESMTSPQVTRTTTLSAAIEEPIVVEEGIPEVNGSAKASYSLPAAFLLPAPDRRIFSSEQWLLCLWIIGGGVTLLPGLRAVMVSRRLRRFAAPAEIHELWQEVAGDTSGFVPVRISGDIEAPGVISALRPEVLLPAGALEWSSPRLASVLRHEFHHVRRHDLLVRWLGRIVRAVLWFHPAVWWVQSRMVIAQERAADESVVSSGVAAADYAGHLLETASNAALFPGIPMARRSQLGGRIHVLLSRGAIPGTLRRGLERCCAIVFTMLAMLAGFLGFAVPATTQAADPEILAEKGLRGSILDRNGEIIATSDPLAMPADLREKPPLRWYPERNAIAPVSGYGSPDAESKFQIVAGTGLEGSPGLAEGKGVKSTIDLRIQRLAWKELERAKLPGSIIVMDPRSGEVLAVASWPAIDPNAYADGVTEAEWLAWQRDEQEPLLNRAFTLHPPASFAKLVLSLAAAKDGLGDRSYYSSSSLKVGRISVSDSHPSNGHFGFRSALKAGRNTWFSQLAMDLGHQRAHDIWHELIQPRRGDFSWQAPASVWFPAEQKDTPENLAIAALGAGLNQSSLLDIASIMSSVADGTAREPSFILGEKGRPPVTLAGIGVKDAELQLIRDTLRENVNSSGSALKAKLERVAVAGIPFSASQMRGKAYRSDSMRILASFAGYAPADEPRYTVAIRLSGRGSSPTSPFYGGTVAAPMAARLLQAIFAETD